MGCIIKCGVYPSKFLNTSKPVKFVYVLTIVDHHEATDINFSLPTFFPGCVRYHFVLHLHKTSL